MKWILILCALSAGLRAQEPEPEPFARAQIQEFLREAQEAYASENPEEAAQRFQALLNQAPEGELNPEALNLAKGMALLKAGNPDEALKAFESITGFEDPEERSRLRNLRGQAEMQIGQAAAAAEEWDQAKSSMEAAVDSFTNALRDLPSEDAARHNLELARKRLAEIIEQMPPPQEQEDDEEQDEEDQEDQEQDQSDQEDSEEESDSSDPSDSSEEEDQEQEPSDESDDSDGSDQEEQDQTDPSDPTDPSETASPEDLDAQQAQQILDAYLEQEKHQRSQILQERIQSIPVEKDW